MFAKLSRWWNGEVYTNPPDVGLIYIGVVYSASAIRARKMVEYIKKEHKFLIGTIIAILSLIFGSTLI